jgi:hypothetical protein
MKKSYSTGIQITRKDFFRLPADMRAMSDDGPMVKTMLDGMQTFVHAIIIN